MWSPWWIWESNIPDTVCDQIIDCTNKIQYEKGGTEKDADGGEWRKVDVKFLYEEFNWINSLMYGYAMCFSALGDTLISFTSINQIL